MRRPILHQLPECLSITLIVRKSVGTDQYIHGTETARFPNELDIAKCKLGNVGPVAVGRSALPR